MIDAFLDGELSLGHTTVLDGRLERDAAPVERGPGNRMQLAYTLLNNPSVVKHRRDHAALKECSSEKRDPSKVHPV